MLNKIQQKHLKSDLHLLFDFYTRFSMFKTVYADNVDVLNAPETVSVQTFRKMNLKTATKRNKYRSSKICRCKRKSY